MFPLGVGRWPLDEKWRCWTYCSHN